MLHYHYLYYWISLPFFIFVFVLFFNFLFRPPCDNHPKCNRCVIFLTQKTDFSATRIPTITWIHNGLNVTHICTKKFYPNCNNRIRCVHRNRILLAIGKTMPDWTLVRWESIWKKILGTSISIIFVRTM